MKMNLVNMPSELMTAVNLQGMNTETCLTPEAQGTAGNSFGNILGLLMNSTQAMPMDMAVTADIIPMETDAAELPVPDMLSAVTAVLEGNTEAELPKPFTEKGTELMTKVLTAVSQGKDISHTELSELIKELPPEERIAFAELFRAVSELTDTDKDISYTDEDVIESVMVIVTGSLKAEKKPVRDSDEKQKAVPEIAADTLAISFVKPAETVQPDAVSTQTDITSEIGSDVRTSQIQNIAADTNQTAEITAEIPSDTADTAPAPDKTDNAAAEFAKALEAVCGEDKAEEIFAKLADSLKASAESEKAMNTPAPESSHISFGRQNVQGVMAKVNRVSLDSEIEIPSAEYEIPSVMAEAPVTESQVSESTFAESGDVSAQIVKRIEMFSEIRSEMFTEKEVTMKLAPEELGKLDIRIKRSDEGFEISFTAEKAEVIDLISKKADELAQSLASRGIALKELSVAAQTVNESSGAGLNTELAGGNAYGNSQKNSSERNFSFGGNSDISSESSDESENETTFNREAKLWVSA